jgi:ferrochelatase
MSRYSGESAFLHGQVDRAGVLLVNLGTPDAPTPKALRRYLAEFLWDPRVVELPRPLWWLILHGVILRLRPPRSARAYRKVWTEQGSPLLVISQRQRSALQAALDERVPGGSPVELAMRYGRPAIRDALAALRRAGVRRLLVLALYPQYSATSTASVFDAVVDELKTWRWLPELRFVNRYGDDAGYIQALRERIERHWSGHGRGERLLFSFHGLPRRCLLQGDPYHCQCHGTARRLAEALGLDETRWRVAFQSRFGREEWLRPYTDQVLRDWAGEGVRSVDVVCPGFAADCLETLEEIAMQNRAVFLQAGGERFAYIPALNDEPAHIQALSELVMRHMQGWPELEAGFDPARREAAAQAARRRALAMGAER